MNTWDKTRTGNISNSAAKMEKLRGQRPADTVSKASKASSVKGRYSTKADALSTGFQEIAQARIDRVSNSNAKPRISQGLPLKREATDSQCQRYRNTIKQLERLQMSSFGDTGMDIAGGKSLN